MKNEIEAMITDITATTAEAEDYTGEDGLLYCGKVDVQDIPIQSHFPYISPGVGNARLSHPFMDG